MATRQTKAQLLARIAELEAELVIARNRKREILPNTRPSWVNGRRPIKCTDNHGNLTWR